MKMMKGKIFCLVTENHSQKNKYSVFVYSLAKSKRQAKPNLGSEPIKFFNLTLE